MKNNYPFLIVLSTLLFVLPCRADEWIRINQLGYLPRSIKVAVFMSEEGSMKTTYRLDFSDFTTPTT